MPTGTRRFGPTGLTLSIPDYKTLGSTAWTNAELVSVPKAQTGMSMSVRLDPMDLAGVQGSRGWGFWNTQMLNVAGKSAMAWFMYQDGTLCPGLECPKGLFVQTQRLGNPVTKIVPLPESLLSRTHTYTITLKKDAVIFYVDGTRVARVTDPAYVPTTPMDGRIWVDNLQYSASLLQFTLAPQWNARPAELAAHWWWQGPTKDVPTGSKMGPGGR